MSKKVLIRKQGGVQQFQNIGGGSGPSFMDLARRVRDPTASGWQKVLAGAGMAGKTAAGIGAINQTAHQMQGGNAFAPLNINYTYQGLDPTTGMQSNVTPGEQQDAIVRRELNRGAQNDLEALTNRNVSVRALAAGNQQLPPPAGLPAETPVPAGHPYQGHWTNAGRTGTPPPTYDPFAAQRNAAIQRGPPGLNQPVQAQAPQPAQPVQPPQPVQPQAPPAGIPPAPAAPAVLVGGGNRTPLPPELAQTVNAVSVPSSTSAATTAPATEIPNPGYAVDGQDAQQQTSLNQYPTYAPNTGPNPPPLPSTPAPGYTPPVAIQPYQPMTMPVPPGVGGNVNPQPQQPNNGLTAYQGRIDPATGQRIPVLRSFVQAIYDEMGDALYKADPHVAGLIISRIYMDKFVW